MNITNITDTKYIENIYDKINDTNYNSKIFEDILNELKLFSI